jgi:chromate transporter
MDRNMTVSRRCLYLFFDFARISTFTLGGGAVMLPLMEHAFVDKRGWLTEAEMLEVFSLVQGLPGIIATNAAVLIGRRVAGFRGMMASVLGVVIPPTVIMILFAGVMARISHYPLTKAAFMGVRAGAAALILTVLVKLARKTLRSFRDILLAVAAFVLLRLFGLDPFLVILVSALAGVFFSVVPGGREIKKDAD